MQEGSTKMMQFRICSRLTTADASRLFLLVLVFVSGCGGSKQASNPEPGPALETITPLYSFGAGINLTPHSGFSQTTRIAVAPGGNVYAFNLHMSTGDATDTADVICFSNYGQGTSRVLAQFPFPLDGIDPTVATSPRTGNVYVTSPDGITVFSDTTGARITTIAPPSPQSGFTFAPYDIVLDSMGNIYIANGEEALKYDSNGNFLSGLPTQISGSGALLIAISKNDAIYLRQESGQFLVMDTNGTKTSIFAPDLSYITGNGGGGIGRIIVNAAGEILVKNRFIDEMDKFSANGTLLRRVKMQGDLGACDDQGRIYVEAFGYIVVYPPL